VASLDDLARKSLLSRGFALEYATLGWNVIGRVVLSIAAVSARSVALAGFGLNQPRPALQRRHAARHRAHGALVRLRPPAYNSGRIARPAVTANRTIPGQA
jgi:hypothetical protein